MSAISINKSVFSKFNHSIGELKEGSLWRNKKANDKIGDILKSVFKLSLVVAASYLLTSKVFSDPVIHLPLDKIINISSNPIINVTLAISCLIATIGLFQLGRHYYKLQNQSDAFSNDVKTQINEKWEDATPLGTFSSGAIFCTKSGAESFKMKKALIKSAKHSIEISGSYMGGECCDEVLDLIEKKLKENSQIEVRIISNTDLLTKKNKEKIKQLAKRYPNNFLFIETFSEISFAPTLRTSENHTKMVIIDGALYVTGGTGIEKKLCGEGQVVGNRLFDWIVAKVLGKNASRDTDQVGEGAAALTLQREFFKLLAKRQGKKHHVYGNLSTIPERTPGCKAINSKLGGRLKKLEACKHKKILNVVSCVIVGSAEHGYSNDCMLASIEMIDQAKEKLHIANMSINDKMFLDAIERALKRGVKVEIISNLNLPKNPLGGRALGAVTEAKFQSLLKKYPNLHVYQYNGKSSFYHKKVLVVDQKLVSMGTYNLNKQSSESDDENIVITESEQYAHTVLKHLKKDKSFSKKALPRQYTGKFASIRRSFCAKILLLASARIQQ